MKLFLCVSFVEKKKHMDYVYGQIQLPMYGGMKQTNKMPRDGEKTAELRERTGSFGRRQLVNELSGLRRRREYAECCIFL